MADSAAASHQRAVRLANAGRYADARRLAAAALARTDDRELRARLTGTLAYVMARQGEAGQAERLCRDALATPGLGGGTRSILEGQLGAMAMYAGRFDEAVDWLTRAAASIVDDPVAVANVRLNRSLVYMQLRRFRDARDDLEAAAETFAAHDERMNEAHARHNLGYLALLEGDLVSALRIMQSVRPLVAESPVSTAIVDVDRAEVLRDAGMTTEAETLLLRAAAVFGRHRVPQSRAEAEYAAARSLLAHDPRRAAQVAGTAARRFRAIGSETWALRADAVRLRAQLAEGVRTARGTLVPAARRPPREEDVDALADALAARGLKGDAAAVRLAAQLRAAQHGRPIAPVRVPRDAPVDVRLLAHAVRAARASAARREAEAQRHAAAGVDELARRHHAFGSLDLQSSLAMHGQPLLMAGLSSAMRTRRPDVLFEWSERARHFSQQVVPLRPPPDPDTAAALAELRLLRSQAQSDSWLESDQAASLRERVRERQWTRTGSAEVQQRASLAEVQAALDADTSLLSFVWSEGALVCLVVTAGAARIVELPGWPEVSAMLPGLRAELDVAAAVRAGPMAQVIRRTLDDRLTAISRRLLDGPVAASGTRRLVITVPGVLNGVPWAMLPAMRGHVFTLAVSATRWLRFRPEAVAVAGSVGLAEGPRVARGEEELDAAARAWRAADVLRGADATVQAVSDLADRVDLLHVAAHGRHAADNPLFSGLELADGTLFGYDIDLIPHVPRAVVLSACEVGRSSVRWGEEALGMTRTWLHAGARCVIAAPVVVADDVACELLGAMHEGLAAGAAPAEALAEASARTGHVAPFQAHGSGF